MRYAVPAAWHAIGVRRWGFHGASHRYLNTRIARLVAEPLRGSAFFVAIIAPRDEPITLSVLVSVRLVTGAMTATYQVAGAATVASVLGPEGVVVGNVTATRSAAGKVTSKAPLNPGAVNMARRSRTAAIGTIESTSPSDASSHVRKPRTVGPEAIRSPDQIGAT